MSAPEVWTEQEYLITYVCPECSRQWHEVWSCGCDSECPNCGKRKISALTFRELDEDA